MRIKTFPEYQEAYKKSVEQPEQFWKEIADTFLPGAKNGIRYWTWNFEEPSIKWFQGAKLNITENCLDRHLETLGDKPAIIWEPNDPEARTTAMLTYTANCTIRFASLPMF